MSVKMLNQQLLDLDLKERKSIKGYVLPVFCVKFENHCQGAVPNQDLGKDYGPPLDH